MPRQDLKTRLITQISQVSGAIEELFFYPEAEEYIEYFQIAQEFFRLLAQHIMNVERIRMGIPQGMPEQPPQGAEQLMADYPAQQTAIGRANAAGEALVG